MCITSQSFWDCWLVTCYMTSFIVDFCSLLASQERGASSASSIRHLEPQSLLPPKKVLPLASFIYLFIYLFIYFWLHWVFIAVHGLSLVAVSGGYSLLRCVGFSLGWLLLLWSMGSRCVGFSSCDTRLSSCGSQAVGRRLSSCGTRA